MESKEQIILKYKEEQLENIKAAMTAEGSLNTFIQLLGVKENFDKPVIIHIETPFEDEDDKNSFVNDGIPMVCEQLKGEKITPICVTFAAEAWMRTQDAKTGKESDKKEVVIITISTEEEDHMHVYEIIRHPYEVDSNGDLVSRVELVEQKSLYNKENVVKKDGRFSNLFSKFAKGLL